MAQKIIAKENIYLNADKSKVVGEDSPEQAFQLIGKGSEVPVWAVEKFGLENGEVPKSDKVAQEDTDDVAKSKKSSENKAEKAGQNKSK